MEYSNGLNEQSKKFAFPHAQLLDIWCENNKKKEAIIEYIVSKIGKLFLNSEKEKEITKKVSNFLSFIAQKLPKCNRQLDRLKITHSEWLSSNITIIIEVQTILRKNSFIIHKKISMVSDVSDSA